MRKEQLTLGQFIAKLGKMPASVTVQYDFCNFRPTTFGSYRGYYDHLALGFSYDGRLTADELYERCRYVVGKSCTGYKGGEFLMTKNTPLWVANYGEAQSTAIVDVLDFDHLVVLETAYHG